MTKMNSSWMLNSLIVLNLVAELLSYEVCSESGGYVYYCDPGWHCCGARLCCYGTRSEDSSTSLSTGAIVGIVIGSIVGLIILISCCVGIVTYMNSEKQTVNPDAANQSRPGNTISYVTVMPATHQRVNEPTTSTEDSFVNVLPTRGRNM